MKNIAVLTSNKGTGTNLQALIDACTNGQINGQICVVVSNAANAYGLVRAKNADIPIEVFPLKSYTEHGKTRQEYDHDLAQLIKKYNPDLIVLAGWILILSNEFLKHFPKKVINLHPGLIPDKKGQPVQLPDGTPALQLAGMHTENAIAALLESGATYGGSTIHFVTEDADWGPVISRVFENIQANDTVETFYPRLKKKENQALVEAVKTLCQEK